MTEDLNKSLILAAEGGDLTTVQKMLAEGANPNAMGPLSAALHCAAFEGHLAIVNLLLQQKANPNLADTRGFFPLQLAASKDRQQIAQALIDAGADLEAKTAHGGTALHVAAASNFPEMVLLLVKAGANKEARDAGGNTPIATACGLGRIAVYTTLRDAGADRATLSDARETLLIKVARALRSLRVKSWFSQGEIEGVSVQYAIKNGYFTFTKNGTKKELEESDQRFCASQSWGPAAHLTYLDTVDIALDLMHENPRLNATDEVGHTAFSLICHAGEARLIKTMIEAGAENSITHEDGFQPIHLVAGSGRLDGLAMFLSLESEVHVNLPDKYGWTPLHWLADIGGDVRMATLLLERGANQGAKSTLARGANMPAGMTPADVAAHWGDAEMAEALKID